MERVIVCAAKDVARMLTTGTLLGCGLLATTAMSGTMHDVWVVGVIVSVISLFHVMAASKLRFSLTAEKPKARMLVDRALHVVNHQDALEVVAATKAWGFSQKPREGKSRTWFLLSSVETQRSLMDSTCRRK